MNRSLFLTATLALTVTSLSTHADTDLTRLEPVRVIGSRSAIQQDSKLLPVDVISGEALRSAGAVGNELGEALAILAPSFSFPRQSNSVTSDHVRSAQLRGLNPDQLLVLINGQRAHVSAVVNDNTKIGRGTNAFDFNTIPLSAVARVEILRDGASAQYGSDAIAGVINIVLDSGGVGSRAGVSIGAHHTRVDPQDRTVTDGQTQTAWLNMGHSLQRGWLRWGVEAVNRNATNRAGPDRISPFIPQTDANLAFAGQLTHRVGDPDTQGLNGWLNGEWDLSGATLYSFATISSRDTEGADIFRHPETNQNVLEVHPNGFLPVTRGDNLDASLNLGLRHDWNGWALDHAAGVGHNRFEFGVDNSVNASLGPASPTRFDSGTFRFTQTRLNSTAERPLADFGPARELRVALGLDYRHEAFSSSAGDPASFLAGEFRFPPELAVLAGLPDIGSQAAKGLAPGDEADEDRDVFGGFVELSGRLGTTTDFSLAGRWEHYSDFGSALAGKLALSRRLTKQLAWRGSISNSFRAPSLAQIGWARRDNTFSSDGGRVSSRLVRNDSAIARALGLRELDEETSLNLSTGLSFSSNFGLSAAIDLFRIEIDDRIIQSDFIRDPAVTGFIQNLPGGEGVQALSAFANAVDTETRGLEASLGYERAIAGGRWRLDTAWSWIETDIDRIRDNPPELEALSATASLVGVEQINTIETANPEHRWITTTSWQGSRLRALARTRYFSSVVREFTFARQRFGSQWALDLETGWQLTPSWEVALGANNVLDEYPDESANANNFFGNFAFDPINPIGVNGRFVYLNTRLNF